MPWKSNKKKEKSKAEWAIWVEKQVLDLLEKNHFNTVKKRN